MSQFPASNDHGKYFYLRKIDISRSKLADKPLKRCINIFNFHPLEVVSRYRDPQLQVGENYTFVYFGTKHLQILMFKHTVRYQNS